MKPIQIQFKSSDEPFSLHGKPSGATLGDFWSWAYSDCINNTTRGVLAEFVVAKALGKPSRGSYPLMEVFWSPLRLFAHQLQP